MKHEPVCQTVFGKKRAEFNSKMQRLGGCNPIQLLSNGTNKEDKLSRKSRNNLEKHGQSKSPCSSMGRYTPHRLRSKNHESHWNNPRNTTLSGTRKPRSIQQNSMIYPNNRTPSKKKYTKAVLSSR